MQNSVNHIKIRAMSTESQERNGKVESVEGFPAWLQEQLNLRNWTAADLAKRARVYHSTISRILSGERKKPDSGTLTAIAAALGQEADEVFRLAGLLEEKKEEGKLSKYQKELVDLTDQLDETSQKMLVEIAKGLVSRSNR